MFECFISQLFYRVKIAHNKRLGEGNEHMSWRQVHDCKAINLLGSQLVT